MTTFSLPRAGILAFMDEESREHLAPYGTVLETAADLVVIKEEDPQPYLYIVVEGSFDVTTRTGKRVVPLDTLGEGNCFGEMAIFQPSNASATVISRGAGKLWRMDVEHLQQYLLDWPHAGCALILGINTILSRRLKHANNVIKCSEIVPAFLSIRARKSPEGATPK